MTKTRPISEGGHYSAYLRKLSRFYQKKEVKIYLNLILSLAAISFFAFFAIRPTALTIAELSKELKDQETVLTRLEKKISELNEARKNFSELEEDLHLISEALPDSPEPSLAVAQIETLVWENNLEINSLGTKGVVLIGTKPETKRGVKTEVKTPYPVFQMDINLSGSYEDLTSFLKELDNLRRVIHIKSVGMSRLGREGSKINLEVKIDIFYLKNEDEKKES